MADITTELQTIESTIYGRDMREALYNALNKLNTDLDDSPTENSTKAVKSGGIYTALSSKIDTSDFSGFAKLPQNADLDDYTSAGLWFFDKGTLSGASFENAVGFLFVSDDISEIDQSLIFQRGGENTLLLFSRIKDKETPTWGDWLVNYLENIQADWNMLDSTDPSYIKNKPVIDNSPTSESNNLVKSGGVYSALLDKINTSDLEGFTKLSGVFDLDNITTGGIYYFNTNYLTINYLNSFSTSSTYAVGDVVLYEGAAYKCKTAIGTAGAWDSDKWEETTVGYGCGLLIVEKINSDTTFQTFLGYPGFKIFTPIDTGFYGPRTFLMFSRKIESSFIDNWLCIYGVPEYEEVATSLDDTVDIIDGKNYFRHISVWGGMGSPMSSITFKITYNPFTPQSDFVLEKAVTEVQFETDSTAPVILYDEDNTYIITWLGTDCYMNGTTSVFEPKANKYYDIIFSFDGSNIIGMVNGYVNAVNN